MEGYTIILLHDPNAPPLACFHKHADAIRFVESTYGSFHWRHAVRIDYITNRPTQSLYERLNPHPHPHSST